MNASKVERPIPNSKNNINTFGWAIYNKMSEISCKYFLRLRVNLFISPSLCSGGMRDTRSIRIDTIHPLFCSLFPFVLNITHITISFMKPIVLLLCAA